LAAAHGKTQEARDKVVEAEKAAAEAIFKARETRKALKSAKKTAARSRREQCSPARAQSAQAQLNLNVLSVLPMPAVERAESPARLELDVSGAVQKCPQEMQRLFKLKMYEVLLRPVLRRLRFWRWILLGWSYTAKRSVHAGLLLLPSLAGLARRESLPCTGRRLGSVFCRQNNCTTCGRAKAKFYQFQMLKLDLQGLSEFGDGWRGLIKLDLLLLIEAALKTVTLEVRHLASSRQELKISPAMSWLKLDKKLSRQKADPVLSDAFKSKLATNYLLSDTAVFQLRNSLWVGFWKPRPSQPLYGISMMQNPVRSWPCVDMRPESASKRKEAGTAVQCDNHRLQNMSKRTSDSMDPEVMLDLEGVAKMLRNPDMGPEVVDAVNLFAGTEGLTNEESCFFTELREEVKRRSTLPLDDDQKSRSIEQLVEDSHFDPDIGLETVEGANACRWGSNFKLAEQVSRSGDLLGVGVARSKAVATDSRTAVQSAANILSDRGFVSGENNGMVLDPIQAHLFKQLTDPRSKAEHSMLGAVQKLVIRPMLAMTSDTMTSPQRINGVGGGVRRVLLAISETIWRSTAWRGRRHALLHRTDGAEMQFQPFSLRLLNPGCDGALRKVLGEDWLPDVLDGMLGAVPTLLKQFRRIASMDGPVLSQTAQYIFGEIFKRDKIYNNEGDLLDRQGQVIKGTFATKMAQLQFHLKIVLVDTALELRDAFWRELMSPQSFTAGMTLEMWSKGAVGKEEAGIRKQILHAHLDGLANAVVMHVMGRDVMSHFKAQFDSKGGPWVNRNPLDFFPPIAFLWSPNGNKSCRAFTGMADSAASENSSDLAPVEPDCVRGVPISRAEGTSDHFLDVAMLCAVDEQRTPILEVRSQTVHCRYFPMPLQQFPFAHILAVRAASASSSAKGIEGMWAVCNNIFGTRSRMQFSTLSSIFTGKNYDSMQLSLLELVEDQEWYLAAAEVARMPGWEMLFASDTQLSDAMHADYKFAKAAKKGPAFWNRTNHDGSYRRDRWENATPKERKKVMKIALRTCQRLGKDRHPGIVARPKLIRKQCRMPLTVDESGGERVGDGGGGEDNSYNGVGVATDAEEGNMDYGGGRISDADLDNMDGDGQGGGAVVTEQLLRKDISSVSDSEPVGAGGSDGSDQEPCDDGRGCRGSGKKDNSDDRDSINSDSDSSDGEGSDNVFADVELSSNIWSVEFCHNVFSGCTPRWPKQSENVWENSKVTFSGKGAEITAFLTRIPSARLKTFLRTFDNPVMASIKFTVHPKCAFLRYIRRCSYGGFSIVNIESISEHVDNDWSKTMQFRRALITEDTLQKCRARNNKGLNLALPALKQFHGSLVRDSCGKVVEEVYHESDITDHADIREIIGVVRWFPFTRDREDPDTGYFVSPYIYKEADLIRLGPPFVETIFRK
jgi:hypothetical protein